MQTKYEYGDKYTYSCFFSFKRVHVCYIDLGLLVNKLHRIPHYERLLFAKASFFYSISYSIRDNGLKK